MSTAQEGLVVKQDLNSPRRDVVEELKELLGALPASLAELERAEEMIREGVLKLGRRMLQEWGERADSGSQRPCCEKCQQGMRHKGYSECTLATTLGDVHIRRVRYRCEACGQERYPQDADLRFAGRSVTWRLAKVISRLGAQLPFEQAQQNLYEDYRVRVCKQTVQQVSEAAGGMLVEQEDATRERLLKLPVEKRPAALPTSELRPKMGCILADGTMIHAAGDWHEIRVGSVVALDADGKILAAQSQARFLSCTDFGHHLVQMARQAGCHQAEKVAFQGDGARWLWQLADEHFPGAVQILDWYHLQEHVHQTSADVYGEGTSKSQRWAKARLKQLWEGRTAAALRNLRELHSKLRAQSKRTSLAKLIQYLENNRRRINYPKYVEAGFPVGSGRVEGACKTLVGGRCKQSGMRNWTRQGAEGVLRIRSTLQNGSFHRLWNQHLKIAA